MRALEETGGRKCFRTIAYLFVLALGSLLGTPCFAQTIDTVYTLGVNRSPISGYTASVPVTQSFILTPQAPIPSGRLGAVPPTGILILLPGGDGNIHLTPTGTSPSDGTLTINSNNFLVRSRWLFAARNFVVITLDSATDFQAVTPPGLTGNQGNAAHITDILQVISWARSNYPGLKVYLVGTSRGTAGAFVAASYSPTSGGPDGLVFTSPVNSTSSDPDSLLALSPSQLASITVPTLLLSNTLDTCPDTPPGNDATVATALTGSPTVAVHAVTGGFRPLSSVCNALSYHGFFGIEPEAVTNITTWIFFLGVF